MEIKEIQDFLNTKNLVFMSHYNNDGTRCGYYYLVPAETPSYFGVSWKEWELNRVIEEVGINKVVAECRQHGMM